MWFHHKGFNMRALYSILALSGLLMLSGCSKILQLVNHLQIERPTAKVQSVKLKAVSFSGAQLAFQIKIINPNALKINLAGLDYNLKINTKDFINGEHKDPLVIAPKDSSMITVPISLNYKKVFATLKSIAGNKKPNYQFSGGLIFNLPVLGKVRIPVNFKGNIPLLKIPKINLKAVRLKAFSWSGADLVMDIAIHGQGGVPLLLEGLKYDLSVGGSSWIHGMFTNQKTIRPDEETTVSVPFKLDFVHMGRAIYNMVSGDAPFDYKLKGNFQLSTDNSLRKTTNFNFDTSSKIKITK